MQHEMHRMPMFLEMLCSKCALSRRHALKYRNDGTVVFTVCQTCRFVDWDGAHKGE